MSAIPGRVVTVADATAATAYRGRKGDVIVADDGTVWVQYSPADPPLQITSGGFNPPNDNLTNLGELTLRFRTLFLGTGITNSDSLVVNLNGSSTRQLTVRNQTAGQVANIITDGGVFVGDGLPLSASLTAPASGVAQVGVNEAIAGLRVTSSFTGVNCVNVSNAITANAPRIGAYGSDGSIALEIASKGAAAVDVLRSDGNNATTVAVMRVAHTTSGTAGTGIGTRIALDVQNGSGARATVGAVQSVATNVSSGSEAGYVELLPSAGASLADAGLRVRSTVTAAQNGLEVRPSAGGGGVVYVAPYGADADTQVRWTTKGAGSFLLRNAADTQTGWGVDFMAGTSIAPVASHAASTAGGAVTVNAVIGQFRILAGDGATPFAIANECVRDSRSVILWHFRGLDATLTNLAIAPSPGGFTVTGNANATSNIDVGFMVVNAG